MEYSFAPLIPLIPFFSAGIILLTQGRLGKAAAWLASCAVGISMIMSMVIFAGVLHHNGDPYHDEMSFSWISTGGVSIDLGLMIDGMTAVMLVVVTIVSFLVHIYSIGYMHGDPRYPRYFGYLNLFTSSMLGLVLANNFLLLFISWELVGVCSYLLIGFWFEKTSAANASKKAFITTKIADGGLLVALFVIFTYCHSFHFDVVREGLDKMPGPWVAALGFLVFLGAMGKSAQVPLHIWLPDAMEGPTPVSALIHAATMVVAGVYLVARTSFLLDASPAAGMFVATIGILTAFIAATIALTAMDIKKVLAYSTVSQLGYMMTAIGVGAVSAGMFHLFTHAFFKALLFLGAGSVIHGAGTQDMGQMGGLRRKMPWTFGTMFIACLAIAGIWPLAGYFSKDEILLGAYLQGGEGGWIYALGTAVAALTAFYMFRLLYLTFAGSPRDSKIHAHESPWIMVFPLVVLALLSITAGMWGVSHHNFEHLVPGGHEGFSSEAIHHAHGFVATVSTMAAIAGIVLATLIYLFRWIPVETFSKAAPRFTQFLIDKWRFDEFYNVVVIKPTLSLAGVLSKFDAKIVDGGVNGIATITLWLAKIQAWFDQKFVDGAVNSTASVVQWSGGKIRKLQSGLVQNYFLIVSLGFVALVIFSVLRSKGA